MTPATQAPVRVSTSSSELERQAWTLLPEAALDRLQQVGEEHEVPADTVLFDVGQPSYD
ncbi:MAG: hypothetical protein Q6L68_00385 [Thermostichus sp. DG02_5_bins_236]